MHVTPAMTFVSAVAVIVSTPFSPSFTPRYVQTVPGFGGNHGLSTAPTKLAGSIEAPGSAGLGAADTIGVESAVAAGATVDGLVFMAPLDAAGDTAGGGAVGPFEPHATMTRASPAASAGIRAR